MRIVLVFRKRNPIFFSIERVFEIVQVPMSSMLPVGILRLPFKGINIRNFFFLQKAKKKAAPESLFHVTGDVHYAVFAFPRNRTLLTIHDSVFMENYSGIKKWAIKKILLDWPMRYAKHITTISEKTKEEIIRLTGCKAEKINVIPNPVSSGIYFADKPFNAANPKLLFLGSTANKNLDRVIPALEGINCVLHIVGKPTETQLEALVRHGIDHFLEHGITDEQLADRYAAADIILFPSLYEGFGLPVIEGFRAGRAVLTSDIAPMNQVAAGAACLVNPEDINSIREGLLKLIRDSEYRNDLIEKGKKVALQYEPEQIAKQYYNLYKKIYSRSCAE